MRASLFALLVLIPTLLFGSLFAASWRSPERAAADPAQLGPYKRVVALTPFSANALALMGIFPEAIGQTLGGDRRYVSSLRSTPRLPMSHPNGPNMELLIGYRPDLVISSPQWAAGRKVIEKIAGRVVIADPNSIAGAYRKVGEIARLVGGRTQGRRLISRMKRSVRLNTQGISDRPRVMLILGVGRTPLVFLKDSWGGEIVTRAGGRLITGGAAGKGFSRISNEVVIAEDPDVIIAVPHGNAKELTPDLKDQLADQWSGTKAADSGRIFFSENNSLLQAGTDIGTTIGKVRSFLGND